MPLACTISNLQSNAPMVTQDTGTTGYVVYDFLLLFHSTQAQFYCNLYHSQILAENHK